METIVAILVTVNTVISTYDITHTNPNVMMQQNNNQVIVKVKADLPGEEKLMIKADSNGNYSCCSENE